MGGTHSFCPSSCMQPATYLGVSQFGSKNLELLLERCLYFSQAMHLILQLSLLLGSCAAGLLQLTAQLVQLLYERERGGGGGHEGRISAWRGIARRQV